MHWPLISLLALQSSVVADSLGWKLVRQVTKDPTRATCEVTRPGAHFERDYSGGLLFTLPLGNARELAADGLTIERFTMQLDDHAPQERIPTLQEVRYAALVLRENATIMMLFSRRDASTLKLTVHYAKDGRPGDGGFQRLTVDIRGLLALMPALYRCPA